MRIPKKIPAWMEAMFVYLAKKDGASARAYKPIMGLVETHWEAFVNDCSDPPAPRAKKAAPKKDDPSQRDVNDDGDAQDMTDSIALDESDIHQDQHDDDEGRADGQDGDEAAMVDPQEQARIDEMVRRGIKSMPDSLRQSLREAYGPPRTPTSAPTIVGPGWRHAEKQADNLYGTFRAEAANVGVPDDHPMALSVSNLYSLAKGAIAARSNSPQ